ncbi:MAG: site-specific integrase [Ilumatobacteraceae bacterium]|nr:site-specific integrase [Ilumatobacteraceae bacterium]
MSWKATGQPTVRKHRGKWAVRIDGIDTTTGKLRPKQIGTYPTQRAAQAAARAFKADEVSIGRGNVSWLLRRYVDGKIDVTPKAREQYQWAIPHIERGLGGIPLSRLDRDDISRWIVALAAGGRLGRRSVQICRNVLRAALADAVDEGLIPRSPAARVPLPRTVAKPTRVREAPAWDSKEVEIFLAAVAGHRWAVGFQLGVLYGLRRSEVLALRWDDLDLDARSLRIDESLVGLNNGSSLGDAKNVRSRRLVPLSSEQVRALNRRRAEQATERLLAGSEWQDNDLIICTRHGRYALPREYDRSLARIVDRLDIPRLTSHGLRHTAATHMVNTAKDVGELRAIADILGHSPEMLLTVYAHALPGTRQAIVDRIAHAPA